MKSLDNQPWSLYKQLLTFCVRRYAHLQCIRLLINQFISVAGSWPISLHKCKLSWQRRAPPTVPPSYIRVRAVVWECGDGQTDTHTQTAVANIHFASPIPDAKCNKNRTWKAWYGRTRGDKCMVKEF